MLDFKAIKRKFQTMLAKNHFDVTARLVMYEKIGTALTEDVSVLEAVGDLHKRYIKRKNPIGYMTGSWIQSIKAGNTFAEAIREWVPEGDVYLIAAGEDRGNLKESFDELLRVTEEQRKIQSLVSSNIYPQFFTVALLLGVIYGFSSYIAPQFKDLIPEEKWPPIAIYYFGFSDAVLKYFAYFGAVLTVVIVLVGLSFKNLTGPVRQTLDKLPPWTIYRELESTKLLIVLSGMIHSGISSSDAISKIEKFSSPYTRYHLKLMRQRLAMGINEGEAMNTGMLPEDLADDVMDYGKRAGFSKGIMSIGRRAGNQVVKKIESNIGKVGKTINYLIYGYAGFAIVTISELVSQMMDV